LKPILHFGREKGKQEIVDINIEIGEGFPDQVIRLICSLKREFVFRIFIKLVFRILLGI